MKQPIVIGITGGIGGGKSTIARVLQKKGYPVYNTDKEAKRLQNEHPLIRKQLIELFGEQVYIKNTLDRKLIAGIVFTNPDLLMKLNKIVHPAVKADFMEWKKKHTGKTILFIESAILYESGFETLVDKTIVVTAPEDVRISRVVCRDKVSPEQVRERIARQLPEEEKIKKADIIIDSNGDDIIDRNIQIILSTLNSWIKPTNQ